MKSFLHSLSFLQQLDSVYNDVKAMDDCCRDMTERLSASQSQTRDLINQTTQLQAERFAFNCIVLVYYNYDRTRPMPLGF